MNTTGHSQRSDAPDPLGDDTWSGCEPLIREFEQAWRMGPPPQISDYLIADESRDKILLRELMHIDLEFRVKAGQRTCVETYLERFPELALDPNGVIALARKYFESIPAHTPPKPIKTTEPEQLGERRVAVNADAQTPLVQVAYHGISGADPRRPAVELLTRILTDGDASRLHRALVEEQKVAISADSYFTAGFDPGLGVLVDTSRNGRRRFCSLACANRVNVAAHRARAER